MNKYRQEYNEKKEKVLNLLNSTKEYYKNYEENNKVAVFEEIIKTVEEDEFSIVLVGEFSSGKSTFLNALMGEKLLPSFTRETTATINYLRHKDRSQNGEEGKVYFSNGRVETLKKADFETINRYVSTEGENVVNTVEHVDLFLDSKFLEGNVTLVDSPGLNGTADGHREVTQAQIEKSSASIFMFKADQPGSDTDFKFIGELKDKVNTIIFALNKIDEIKESEGETAESVIESLKKIYKEKFPDANTIPEIWGISAYQALVARSNQKLDYRGRNDYTQKEKENLEEQSQMGAFEDRLWQFMTKGEKARVMLLSPVDKVITSLEKTRISAEENLNVLKGKDDKKDLEEKILEINNQINSIQNNIEDTENEIEDKLELLIEEFGESLDVKLERVKEKQLNKLDDWTDLEELIDYENIIVKDIQKDYQKITTICEDEFRKGIKKIVVQNYRNIAKDLNKKLKDLNFKVQIDTKYEPSEYEFELGIKQYEESINNLEKSIEDKEKELDNIEDNLLKARKVERDKTALQNRLNTLKKEKEFYSNQLSPKKEYITEMVDDKMSRGGIGGTIVDFFIGKKEVKTTKNKWINQEEIEEFKKFKKTEIETRNEEIKNIEQKLRTYASEESESYEIQKKRLIERLEKVKEDKRKKQEDYKQSYLKKNKAALRQKKNELGRYLDDIKDEYNIKLEEELYNKKDTFLNVIKSSITNNLSIKLEEKNNELLVLQNKLESSQEEKKLYEERLNKMLEDSESILADAIAINTELESEEIDEIEEVML